jgi:hypothetical protein
MNARRAGPRSRRRVSASLFPGGAGGAAALGAAAVRIHRLPALGFGIALPSAKENQNMPVTTPRVERTTVRYCGYVIRCEGESFTVLYAGDEVLYQLYPGSRDKLGGEALGPWVLDQAKAFVDAHRAGKV